MDAIKEHAPSAAKEPSHDHPAESTVVPEGCRALLAQYRTPALWHSVGQLLTSLISLVLLWGAMWISLQYSYWLTLLLSIPTAGFLVRLFVLQHDCGHGSFFNSKLANDIVGRALTVITLTPYQRWRKNHAVHHATSGDLDRRGFGDIHMLTVAEYMRLTPAKRFVYRLHRNPWVLFGIGPIFYFAIYQRFAFYEPKSWIKERASVYWTNLALVLFFGALAYLIGVVPLLLIHLPAVVLGSSVGVWLFYVQHHFEAGYWEHNDQWDYFEAGMAGSSYYELPRILQWFTANIALHHIHHLDSQIPNYRLQACFDENPAMQRVQRISLRQSLTCASLKLWDEKSQKMVGFPSS